MPIAPTKPPAEQENPYLPPGPEPLLFEVFETINTSTTRVGVDDKQMAWCSGYIPIGPRMLRTLPGIGPILWTVPQSQIVFYSFANIGALPVAIIFLADGSIWQVATTTGAVTPIASNNTIVNPSTATTGVTQWGSKYVLIVNSAQANGYFIWDGTVFYRAGTVAPTITITNVGSGYTAPVTASVSGGSGSGATFNVSLSVSGGVTSYSILSEGQYSQPSASVVITGGGPGSGAILSPNFTQVGASFLITSFTIVAAGSGYTSNPIATISSPYTLLQAGVQPIISTVGTIAKVVATNSGNGYLVSDGTSLSLSFSGGAGSGAAATIDLMPFGVSGTDVETFAQRVWIINGPLLQWSAPGSVDNFATSTGGGSVTSNDSFLRVGYTRLVQTNGFLYLIADSSINYISGVQTSGSPPTTTFTNQNADPEVGTPYPATCEVFGRNIVLANSIGVHVSYGAAVTKVSEALDGVFNTVPNFGGFQPSAAKATIFGKKTWILLVPIIDPVTNLQVNELILWDGQKKWFASLQDVALIFINFQEINSVLTAWGTDGANLFPLFAQPSTAFVKTVQSKLWARPGGYQFLKATTRLWGIAQYFNTASPQITVAIDNESASNANTYQETPSPAMVWVNASARPVAWTNASVQPVTWMDSILGFFVFPPQAVGQTGVLTGMTISTSAADLALVTLMLEDEIVGYRG